MLKLCESPEELDFLPADPFCAKIRAYALTYGCGYDFARFYVQQGTAALCRIDGNVTLYCADGADFDEIKSFLSFLGYASLQCSESVMKKLGIVPVKSSYIIKYNTCRAVKPEAFTDEFDARSVYALLKGSGFDFGSFEAFAESICLRLGRGTASFGGIVSEGELCSCAFRLFEDSKAVLLGAVATDSRFRGKGLASSLVPYMASGEKETFLFCRNDELLTFYKNCGFAPWGRWAESNGVTI